MTQPISLAARLLSVIAVSAVVASLVACGDDDADAADVLAEYVDAYNAHDLDAAMALFSDDAVMTAHPLDDDSPANGVAEIRVVHVIDMPEAAPDDALDVTDVVVEGNEVTFNHRWHAAGGDCYSGVGHSIVVQDDKIVSWTWPSVIGSCA